MKILWRQEKKKVNRRVQKKKAEQVRRWDVNPRLMTLAGTGLILLAVAYGVWLKLVDPQTLPFQQVKLEAPFNKVSKAELHEAVKLQVNGGFFSLDVDAVTAAVSELPWVSRVEVRRVWPDTLHVTVNEQMAMARWRDQALVNVNGELFYPAAETFPEGLIELRGPENTVAMMARQFHIFNAALQQGELGLKRITLTQRRAWELELSDTTKVLLGRSEVEKRLQRFVQFYPQLQARAAAVKRVDMRYTNGFAVLMGMKSESSGDRV